MRRTSADAPGNSSSSSSGGGSSECGGSGSAKSSRGGSAVSRTPQSASTSFFIIQEPVISPSGSASPPSKADRHSPQTQQPLSTSQSDNRKKSRKKDRSGSPSRLSRDENTRGARALDAGLAPSSSSGAILLGVHEELNFEGDDTHSEDAHRKTNRHGSALASSSPALSILNRVGSAPDLPLHSSVSAGVYSSSKKRNLMKSASPNGAGPHLVAMQRSRLIPLPINIRTGTLNRDAFDRKPSNNNATEIHSHTTLGGLSMEQMEQQTEDKANDDYAIASLKQRLAQMEKGVAKDVKYKHALEKQVVQLTKENQCVLSEKQQLLIKIEQLEKNVLQQKHAFEKLSGRYASVYSNLQKLTEQQASSSPENHLSSVQSVLQALTKENQEFQRKLRVLEARHVEDKALAGNQEKKLKRLRAEMEALQHMNEANNRDDVSEVHSEFSYKSPADLKHLQAAPSSKLYGAAVANPQSTKNGSLTRTAAQAPTGATGLSHNSNNGSASHLIGAEDYQYIDPNILKVLEKVDSQFSITNAINLSVVLKKWLNCCLHVTCSTHIPTVLQGMLKRICELLHCEHAALFEVDHAERKLTGRYSEGGDVHWELPLDKGIIGYAARMNALCNVQRAYDDPRFYSSTDTITGLPSRELLCVPLVHELQPGQPHSVFAVLQAWNTTHQKPFTSNDQILGCLLTIQTGTVFLQTRVAKTLQKINNKLIQILHMPQEIVEDESASPGPPENTSLSPGVTPLSMSAVHLVANAQTKFSECIGIKKLKIFVLDAEVMKIWHVGSEVDADGQLTLVRKYSNVLSSLCGLVLKSTSGIILDDPTSEATFNDTVDLQGGAGGMHLVPILSPWSSAPLGMVQVARSAKSSLRAVPGVDPGFTAAIAKEKQLAQNNEDVLTMDLIDVFARVFASLLHHVKAQQLYDACPKEIQDARLAYLTDRLDCLESEYAKEQEEADEEEARLDRTLAATAMMEQRILESARAQSRERTPLRVATPEAPLMSEGDAVRRASFTEAIAQPQSKGKLRDNRRISSAGSSRKSVTFHPGLGVLAAPDTLYVEGGHEEEDEDDEDANHLDDATVANTEDDRGSSDEAEGSSSAITSTESPTTGYTDREEGVDENGEEYLLHEADDGNWQSVDRDEEQQLGEEAAVDSTEAEQTFVDPEQDAGIAAFGAGADHMQPQEESAMWSEEAPLESDGEHNDMAGEGELKVDQPGDEASWLQEQQGEPDFGYGSEVEIAQEPGLEHEGDGYWHEEEKEQLGEEGAVSHWQEDGDADESSPWRGQDEDGDSSDPSPVGLISTDSMYAIDLNYSDESPAEVTNPAGSDSFSPVDEQADGEIGILEI